MDRTYDSKEVGITPYFFHPLSKELYAVIAYDIIDNVFIGMRRPTELLTVTPSGRSVFTPRILSRFFVWFFRFFVRRFRCGRVVTHACASFTPLFVEMVSGATRRPFFGFEEHILCARVFERGYKDSGGFLFDVNFCFDHQVYNNRYSNI